MRGSNVARSRSSLVTFAVHVRYDRLEGEQGTRSETRLRVWVRVCTSGTAEPCQVTKIYATVLGSWILIPSKDPIYLSTLLLLVYCYSAESEG